MRIRSEQSGVWGDGFRRTELPASSAGMSAFTWIRSTHHARYISSWRSIQSRFINRTRELYSDKHCQSAAIRLAKHVQWYQLTFQAPTSNVTPRGDLLTTLLSPPAGLPSSTDSSARAFSAFASNQFALSSKPPTSPFPYRTGLSLQVRMKTIVSQLPTSSQCMRECSPPHLLCNLDRQFRS